MKQLSPLFTDLGNLIREKRHEKGLTIEELAYRCDMHYYGIYKIEKAKSEIKLSTLLKIIYNLDIDITELKQLFDKFNTNFKEF